MGMVHSIESEVMTVKAGFTKQQRQLVSSLASAACLACVGHSCNPVREPKTAGKHLMLLVLRG